MNSHIILGRVMRSCRAQYGGKACVAYHVPTQDPGLWALAGLIVSVAGLGGSSVHSNLDANFSTMNAKMDARFDSIDAKLDKLDAKSSIIDARIAGVKDCLDAKLDSQDRKIDGHDSQQDANRRKWNLEQKLSAWLVDVEDAWGEESG
eukprot:scaffold255492_cov44-Attheya_sp.AAC.3